MKRHLHLIVGWLWLAGIQSGLSQSFSLNAVGYVDVNLQTGSNLVANPLNAASNTVGYLFGRVPDGSSFLPWDAAAGSFGPTNHFSRSAGWSQPDALFVQPASGFLFVPSPVTVSFHGEPWALARGPVCLTYPASDSYSGWFPPSNCGFCDPVACPPFSDGTVVSVWDAQFQVYNDYLLFEGFGWVPHDPVIPAGHGFRLANPQASFGRSPFLSTIGATEVVQGRRFGFLENLGRNGTNMTFRVGSTGDGSSEDGGYSLFRANDLSSNVWQLVVSASNGPVNFSVPVAGPSAFYKVHPYYTGSAPVLISRARVGASYSFDFYAPSNAAYQVERSGTFPFTSSQVITSVVASAGSLVTVTDGAASAAVAYYRVSF